MDCFFYFKKRVDTWRGLVSQEHEYCNFKKNILAWMVAFIDTIQLNFIFIIFISAWFGYYYGTLGYGDLLNLTFNFATFGMEHIA